MRLVHKDYGTVKMVSPIWLDKDNVRFASFLDKHGTFVNLPISEVKAE